MTTSRLLKHPPNGDHNMDDTAVFGFWIYILSDCILFSMIFAAFAVLHTNTYGGPALKEFISLPYVFGETMVLLTSSLTYGMAILSLYQRNKTKLFTWLAITFGFGSIFIGMELREFMHLYSQGYSWQTNAALSSFFTLVGTHGLHVGIGLLWMLLLMVQLLSFGTNTTMVRRLTYLGLFWAFLDIVWIFVFTFVYLMESI